MDGVMVEPHEHHHLPLTNLKFGTNYTLEDITHYTYKDSPTIEDTHADFMFSCWNDSNLYENMPWIESAEVGVSALRMLGEVIVVSYAMDAHMDSKMRWLRDKGFDKEHIVLTHRKDILRGDLMIDDNPLYLEQFQGNKICFDRPWNQDCKHGLRRDDWGDVVLAALAIKKYRYNGS